MRRLFIISMLLVAMMTMAQVTPVSQMENLDRGLVAVPAKSKGIFLSWRLLGTDTNDTRFTIYRGSEVIAENKKLTNWVDEDGTTSDSYTIQTVGGPNDGTSDAVTPWENLYKTINLQRPEGGSNLSGDYTYEPNDCSVGDVDGDGQYELFVKWMPSLQNHSWPGVISGPLVLDCYRLDGSRLWRINLGRNLMASDHVTQFMVYDFDGDGKAEMICKTAPGSVDGQGNYVSAAATDATILSTDNDAYYVDETATTDPDTGEALSYNGFVKSGPEFLTVFNGLTGAAMHTIYYRPNRNMGWGGAPSEYSDLWGDSYGGRAERHLACVAHLDGPESNPSAVMCRGIYRAVALWAVDFDGTQLKQKWLHISKTVSEVEHYDQSNTMTTHTYTSNTFDHVGASYTSFTAFAQGCHSLTVGDVDQDGKDEIVYGGATIDDNGMLLYSTGLGHGDALHLGDLDPDRPGLEIYKVNEQSPYGAAMWDAKTGEPIWRITANGDTGRGVCFDIDSRYRGNEKWCSYSEDYVTNLAGEIISENKPTYNFRIYWDGDLQDELLDNGCLDKWVEATNKSTRIYPEKNTNLYNYGRSCNGTKATPNLMADLLGDWREEVILWSDDGNGNCFLRLVTSNERTDYRVPTLMHDHTYRMAIAWQNVGYNQPPHLGYYLPDYAQETIHAISIDATAGGTVESNRTRADIDETVTLTVTNLLGYELESLTVEPTTDDDSDMPILGAPRRSPEIIIITPTKVDDTHYTFTMPAYDVTVKAIFKLADNAKTLTVKKEWTVFCSPVTYNVPAGLKAYTISAITLPNGTEDGTINLKEQAAIAKDVPMILWNNAFLTATTFAIVPIDDISIPDDDKCSEFKGSSSAPLELDPDKTNYVLKNGSFVPTIANQISQYSCYLELTAAHAPHFNRVISHSEQTTSVHDIGTAMMEKDVWYNLHGVRIEKPDQKGVYIHNGKKIVIR